MTEPDFPDGQRQAWLLRLIADLWLGTKLLLVSAALAFAIKALGPSLALPATTPVVVFLILFPSIGMGLIFLARQRLSR